MEPGIFNVILIIFKGFQTVIVCNISAFAIVYRWKRIIEKILGATSFLFAAHNEVCQEVTHLVMAGLMYGLWLEQW